MSTHVYLSTWPRKNWLRLVPFSRMISARSTNARVVDQQRAALAGNHVLGFVKAKRAEVPDAAKRAPLVLRHDALRGILDHEQAVPSRRSARSRPFRSRRRRNGRARSPWSAADRRLDQGFVEVQRVGPNVDEHRPRAAQHERVRRRHERKDGMITSSPGCTSASSAAISSAAVHECVSMPLRSRRGLEPRRAFPGERSVTGKVAVGMRLSDVPELLARHVGLVEGITSISPIPCWRRIRPPRLTPLPTTLKVDRGSENRR